MTSETNPLNGRLTKAELASAIMSGIKQTGRLRAVFGIATFARMTQLEEAADLWHIRSRLLRSLLGTPVEPVESDERDAMKMLAARFEVSLYRLSVHRAAWDIVCRQLGIPRDYLDQVFGKCESLVAAGNRSDRHAPSPEGILDTLKQIGESVEPSDLLTAEHLAALWLALFEDLEGD